jgi:hypothetical protein
MLVARALGAPILVDGQPFDCPAYVVNANSDPNRASSPIDSMIQLAELCGSREWPVAGGGSVNSLNILAQAMRQLPAERWNEDRDTYLAARALLQLVAVGPLHDSEPALASEVASMLVEHSSTWAAISRHETLSLLLSKVPTVLSRGGLAGLLDSTQLPPESAIDADLGRLREALRLPDPEPITQASPAPQS